MDKEEFLANAPFTEGLQSFKYDENSPLDADKVMVSAIGHLSDVTMVGQGLDGELYMASSLPLMKLTLARLKSFVEVVESILEEK